MNKKENKSEKLRRPVHSDFIIHWTGIEIDEEYNPDWFYKSGCNTKCNKDINNKYIERLKDILKCGLWMNIHSKDEFIEVAGNKIKRPLVPRTCFTELKLSEARYHAKRFGRLGIGFKRFFLFDRFGSPMIYYHPIVKKNWFFCENISKGKSKQEINNFLSCFLKPMCPPKNGNEPWEYTYFDESEWRIIYSEDIKKCLNENGHSEVNNYFEKYDLSKHKFESCLENNNKKPEYLIPLKPKHSISLNRGKWFSMIIYPSLDIKNIAQKDSEIRELIHEIKPPKLGDREAKSYPIELTLDACRNF